MTKNYLKIIIIIIVSHIIVQQFFPLIRIAGSSMEPTIHDRQIVIGQRIIGDLERGDIVFFYSKELEYNLVKRVIAIPGDTIEIRNNVVYLNGQALEESYVEYEKSPDYPAYTLRAGECFFMGDNRASSLDSRSQFLGTVQKDQIKFRINYMLPIRIPKSLQKIMDLPKLIGAETDEVEAISFQ